MLCGLPVVSSPHCLVTSSTNMSMHFILKYQSAGNGFSLTRINCSYFFKIPIHLVTKWRNRLLSSTANLKFELDRIGIKHLENLIDNESYTKLDHGLVMSDINPKDRQNYHSCIKLISDDVLNLLMEDGSRLGMVVYLKLLKMIVKAYIDKTTTIQERMSISQIRIQQNSKYLNS